MSDRKGYQAYQTLKEFNTVAEQTQQGTGMAAGWAERLPWVFVAGVAVYMQLADEPSISLWGLAAVVCCVICLWGWRRGRLRMALVALMATALLSGLVWGAWSAERAAAPVLQNPMWKTVEGTVERVDLKPRGMRVLLRDTTLYGGPDLHAVRIYIPDRIAAPMPGDRIRLRASLMPLPQPVHPQSYNMPRQGWFQQLGAVGFTYSSWEKAAVSPPDTWHMRLERWRQTMRQRILAAFTPEDTRAGVAAALLVGDRGRVAEDVAEAYRGAGMAHILAISGLHMSLLAGLAYVLMRRGLALVPGVALRYPIKKWAAALALLFTAVYLGLSGASVPTQRAFIMTAVALCAVMLERSPFSLRLVGLAAFVVVLFSPQAVTGASFQMSFAAVLALIAVYQGQGRLRWLSSWPWWLRWPLIYVAGVVMTTLIASLATAPVALYHFGRVASYSVVANALALPVFGLWVMPWGLVATALLPFDTAEFALARMADGIGVINAVAAEVVSWPHAILNVPKMTELGYAVCLLGGVWLALSMAGRVRWIGVGLMVLGLSSAWWRPAPDVLIADQGQSIAVREADGYGLQTRGRSSFLTDVWQATTGLPMHRKEGWSCDAQGCVAKGCSNWWVARSHDPASLATDCAQAQVVVAMYVVGPVQRLACGQAKLLDQNDLQQTGATALWLNDDGAVTHMDTLQKHQNQRYWRGFAP